MANAFRFYNSAKTFFKELVLAEPTANRTIEFPDASGTVALESYSNSLLAEYEVTGSAVTSIDFSGLDINTHKSYRVEMELINATGTSSQIYCFVNGNTTLSNYNRQYYGADGVSTSAARANDARICDINLSMHTKAVASISIVNSKAMIISDAVLANNSTTAAAFSYNVFGLSTITNITQLTFTSLVASAIGVGSKIRIYRGNV